MKRLLVFTVLFYSVGIMLGVFMDLSLLTLVIAGLGFLAAGLFNNALAWRKTGIFFLLSVIVAGMIMFEWHVAMNKGNLGGLAGKQVAFIGTVCEEPDYRIDRVNYIVKIEEELTGVIAPETVRGKVLVVIKGSGTRLAYGDRVEIRATPEVPDTGGNPGDFDYKAYLQTKGVELIVRSTNGTGIIKIGRGEFNPLLDSCLKVKDTLNSILARTLQPSHAAIMEGLLFGSAGKISFDVKNDFALTGVVHILSVSGYHMVLLVGVCLFVGRLMKLGQGLNIFLIVAVTLFYTILTGASPPVLRAMIMAWVMMIALILKRDYDWPSSMSAAALIILIVDPQALFNAGFQLTFTATWGLFYLAPLIHRFLSGLPYLSQEIAATIAAQLAVLPITAYYFSYLSVVSVLANLIIVPVITIAMLLGSVGMFAGLLWLPLGEVINIVTGFVLEAVIKIAHLMAGLPMAVVALKQPSLAVILGIYIIIAVFSTVANKELYIRIKKLWYYHKPKIVLAGLLAAAILLWVGIFTDAKGKLEVVFIDIGQGDAALVTTPGGKTLIIDTGGIDGVARSNFNPGEQILIPFLRRQGINSIDLMVLSHPHGDHIQGAEAILKYMDVNLLLVNDRFSHYEEGAKLLKLFGEKGVKVQETYAGDKTVFDRNVILETLETDPTYAADENDASLVVRLGYGDFHVLFTGDAEKSALDKLTELSGMEADIIKVPHHGAKNGWVEELYRKADAELAVISVGEHNFYGHPSREVLEGLSGLGIPVLRTDEDGAVMIRSDGHTYEVETGRKTGAVSRNIK